MTVSLIRLMALWYINVKLKKKAKAKEKAKEKSAQLNFFKVNGFTLRGRSNGRVEVLPLRGNELIFSA